MPLLVLDLLQWREPKADIFEHSVVEKDAPVEEEGWVHQRVIEHVIWIRHETYPNWRTQPAHELHQLLAAQCWRQ